MLVHLIEADTPEVQLQILNIFRGLFLKSGSGERQMITLPSLVFGYIKLVDRIRGLGQPGEIDMEKLFGSTKEVVDIIAELDPELGLKLYLELAYCIDRYDVKQEVILV